MKKTILLLGGTTISFTLLIALLGILLVLDLVSGQVAREGIVNLLQIGGIFLGASLIIMLVLHIMKRS